jgi:hypothetical protein
MKSEEVIHTESGDGKKFTKTPVNENEIEIRYTGQTAHTLGELLDLCNVDLNEWEVVSHVVNVWENFRALKRKDLSFNEGAISGKIKDKGGVTIVPLHQVKARLVRRKPIALQPVIAPVQFTAERLVKSVPETKKLVKTALLLPDPQFGFFRERQAGPLQPFHDRNALSVALALAQDLQPDDIIFLGDLLDLPDWSNKFITDPTSFQTTQPSLIEAAWWLAMFSQAVPNSKKMLLEGNHDERLERLLKDRLPSAYGLHSVKADGVEINLGDLPMYDFRTLLDLDRIGYEYIDGYPNNSIWLNNSTEILHGTAASGKPMATAVSQANRFSHNTIFGHIHRTEQASRVIKTVNGDEVIFSASPGCLCRTDYVVPGHKRGQTWNQGVGIVTYTKSHAQIDLVNIVDGMLFHNGRAYTASTVRKEVQRGLKSLAKL